MSFGSNSFRMAQYLVWITVCIMHCDCSLRAPFYYLVLEPKKFARLNEGGLNWSVRGASPGGVGSVMPGTPSCVYFIFHVDLLWCLELRVGCSRRLGSRHHQSLLVAFTCILRHGLPQRTFYHCGHGTFCCTQRSLHCYFQDELGLASYPF